jgi:hypothetical protein
MIAPTTERVQLAFAVTDGVGTHGTIDPRRLVKLAEYSSASLSVALVSPGSRTINGLQISSLQVIGAGYAGGIVRPPATSRPVVPYRSALDATVKAAGGLVIDARLGDTLPSLFKRVLDDFRQSYVLRYTPRGVTPGGWHDVVVTVPKRPDLVVRARKGYEGS